MTEADDFCARCGRDAGKADESCWFCHRTLCGPCWDVHGHCGHTEVNVATQDGKLHLVPARGKGEKE